MTRATAITVRLAALAMLASGGCKNQEAETVPQPEPTAASPATAPAGESPATGPDEPGRAQRSRFLSRAEPFSESVVGRVEGYLRPLESVAAERGGGGQ
jgi:hypothetical protein